MKRLFLIPSPTGQVGSKPYRPSRFQAEIRGLTNGTTMRGRLKRSTAAWLSGSSSLHYGRATRRNSHRHGGSRAAIHDCAPFRASLLRAGLPTLSRQHVKSNRVNHVAVGVAGFAEAQREAVEFCPIHQLAHGPGGGGKGDRRTGGSQNRDVDRLMWRQSSPVSVARLRP